MATLLKRIKRRVQELDRGEVKRITVPSAAYCAICLLWILEGMLCTKLRYLNLQGMSVVFKVAMDKPAPQTRNSHPPSHYL